jgi:hypothetical protein
MNANALTIGSRIADTEAFIRLSQAEFELATYESEGKNLAG